MLGNCRTKIRKIHKPHLQRLKDGFIRRIADLLNRNLCGNLLAGRIHDQKVYLSVLRESTCAKRVIRTGDRRSRIGGEKQRKRPSHLPGDVRHIRPALLERASRIGIVEQIAILEIDDSRRTFCDALPRLVADLLTRRNVAPAVVVAPRENLRHKPGGAVSTAALNRLASPTGGSRDIRPFLNRIWICASNVKAWHIMAHERSIVVHAPDRMLRIELLKKVSSCNKLRQTRNRYLIRRIPRQKRGMILHLANIPLKPRAFISRRIDATRTLLLICKDMVYAGDHLDTIRRRSIKCLAVWGSI